MAAAGLTHSQLAAKLVEGCLAHIAGNTQNKLPIEAVTVTELERADVGLKQSGQTLAYPLGASHVFLDLDGAVATIWYIDADYELGLTALETALKTARSVKQLKDEPRGAPKQRLRSYQVELGGNRLAHVLAEYAERGASQTRFLVRVVAQVRK